MNATLMRLAERRQRLCAQAATQRRALVQEIEVWRQPLAIVDQGLHGLQVIKRNPIWLAGGVGLLVALRPVRVGAWLRRGWIAWRVLRTLRNH